ncbi:MAG: hypothetical protein AAF845_07250 [Bacteroidota bacterium]
MSRLSLALTAALALAACQDADAPEALPAPPTPEAATVIDGEVLLERFPEAIGPYPLAASSAEIDGALGFEVARATARYTVDINVLGPAVVINVLDLGSAEMAENMGYGWGLAPDTAGTEAFDGYPAQRESGNRTRTEKLRVLVGQRFLVEVTGEGAAYDRVEEATRALDLDDLAAIAAR